MTRSATTIVFFAALAACSGPDNDADSLGTSTSSSSGSTGVTGSSSEGGETAASESGDDGTFVTQPDMGPSGECDPLLQDCPEGSKCTAHANDGGTFWNANVCVEITGTGVVGDPCTAEGGTSGVDDCGEGLICMSAGGDGVSSCVQFCQGEQLTCPAGDMCAVYNNGVLPLCLDGCDPLLQDCPDGQACIDTPNGNFICFSDASGTAGADGDVCPPVDGENSCDPGLWCGPNSAGCTDVKCCTPYCDLTNPECTDPDICISFYGDPASAPPQYVNVGVCVLP